MTDIDMTAEGDYLGDTSHEADVQLFMDYLQAKKCTLWGSSFSLHNEDGRRDAAEWFLKVLDEVNALVEGQVPE